MQRHLKSTNHLNISETLFIFAELHAQIDPLVRHVSELYPTKELRFAFH